MEVGRMEGKKALAGQGLALLLFLLVATNSAQAQINGTALRDSCRHSLRFCNAQMCPKLTITEEMESRVSQVGYGYNVKADKGFGLFHDQVEHPIFNFSYCRPGSPSASPASAPAYLPCEALYDEFSPPNVLWNRDVKMFTSLKQYSRERFLSLGLAGTYEGITGSVGFQGATGTQKLNQNLNYMSVSDRRAVYAAVGISDWRCYPFSRAFKDRVNALDLNNYKHSSYKDLISEFGHSVITQVEYGGRLIHRATVSKCVSASNKVAGYTVQGSAYQELGEGLKAGVGVSFDRFEGNREEKLASVDRVQRLGGDGSFAQLDSDFLKFVASVKTNQHPISVTEDNSLTPIYDLLSANINLLEADNTFDAVKWKRIRENMRLAIQLDLNDTAVMGKSETCSSTASNLVMNTLVLYLGVFLATVHLL